MIKSGNTMQIYYLYLYTYMFKGFLLSMLLFKKKQTKIHLNKQIIVKSE